MPEREVRSVPLHQLFPDSDQPRKAFSDEALLGLARTLAEGQLHPILAYPQDDRLIILDGERRWRAAKLAGLRAVDVMVVAAPSPEEALAKALVANVQREDLSPIEKARAIARLMEATSQNRGDVAKMLGLSAPTVTRLLTLLQLPLPVQEKVAAGELSASTAYAIANSPEGTDLEAAANEVLQKGLSRDTVMGRQRSRQPSQSSSTKTPGRVVAKLAGGRSVALSGEGLSSLDDLIQWIEELLSKARKARPRGMELSTFVALLRDEAKAAPGVKPQEKVAR